MSSGSFIDNMAPTSLVREAQGAPLRRFLTLYGDTMFVLVRLDDSSGGLAAGLSMETGSTAVKPSMNVMGYHTSVANHASGPPVPSQPAKAAPSLSAGMLTKALERAPHFVAPLRKRDAADVNYMDRISVGRARNKDLVLRHPSISKFHAWVEMSEAAEFFLADAGSRNGTRVAGRQLPAKELVALPPNTEVELGSVRMITCDPETLWKLLNEEQSDHRAA